MPKGGGRLPLLRRWAWRSARGAGTGEIFRRYRPAARWAGEVTGNHRRKADQNNYDIGGAHRQSRDRPNSGRSLIPTAEPASAIANHTQPCGEPEPTPPTKAP